VSLTTPSNGQNFTAPSTVTISASASDSDGAVSKVEFFNGSVKLGEKTSAPYTFTWSGVAVGSYNITAVATDNLNAKTTSGIKTIWVNN
jgi:chitinase